MEPLSLDCHGLVSLDPCLHAGLPRRDPAPLNGDHLSGLLFRDLFRTSLVVLAGL